MNASQIRKVVRSAVIPDGHFVSSHASIPSTDRILTAMHFLILSMILGAFIVAAMVFITPILNAVPNINHHYKGLILLAVVFLGCGVIFGYYNDYGILDGVIDSLLLFVFLVAIDWLWRRLRGQNLKG
jgi:DMSO reductase anchor subunit